MTRLRWPLRVLMVALVVTAVWLALDNPEIDGTSKGGGYTCAAPWDTGVLGASNYPGGEPPSDADVIAQRCQAAGERRFDLAVLALAGAVFLNAWDLLSGRPRRKLVGALRRGREETPTAG